MRKLLVAAGVAAGLTFASYLAFSPASDAGWGPPFACGAGANTAEINWDNGIQVPGSEKPVITGILGTGTESSEPFEEWTIDELKAGKPLLVYRYLDGSTDAASDSYKFSQAFEIKVLSKDDIVKQINDNWKAKRSPIDPTADQKKPENQAAVTFYSFTGQKLGELSIDDSMSSRNFTNALTRYEAKNKALCAKEIKRLEALEKSQQDSETAAK